MITFICYLLLKIFLKDDWSNWSLVIPLLLDFIIIAFLADFLSIYLNQKQ